MTIKPGQILAFFWLIIISLFYYASFPITNLMAGLPAINIINPQFKSLEHILCLVLFIIAANGWAGTLWSNSHLSHLERFLFSTAAGLGAMSLLTLFFNVIGVTNNLLYFFFLLSGFVLFVTAGKNIHGILSTRIKSLMLISLVPLISTIIGALAPPTQFDSLVYHLALPAEYLKAGKMFTVPHNIFFSFPQGMEMLYGMALRLDGPILANLLHWMFLPLGALAIYSFCSKFWGHKSAVTGSIIWLFTPAAMFVSTGTYVDLALAFYVFISVYCFMLWKDSGRTYFIYLCAIFSGLACGIKYTAFINVLILSALFVFSGRFHSHNPVSNPDPDSDEPEDIKFDRHHLHTRNSHAQRLRACLKYVMVVSIVFFPWLLKNFIYLNNPIAPWGAAIFTASKVSAGLAGAYFKHIAGHGLSIGGIRGLLLLPWYLTFYGYKYGGGFDIMGPVFLLFIPILFLRMKIDKIEKILVAYCLMYLAVWIVTGKVMRFLMPVLPFLCILSGKGAEYIYEDGNKLLESGNKIFRYAVAVILAVAVTHNILFYHWVMASVDPYSYVIGGMEDSKYISNRVNYYKAADEMLGKLGPGTKTVFLGETRSFYFTNNVIAPTNFDTNPLIAGANTSQSPEKLLETLKHSGITHVFLNKFEFQRLSMRSRFTDKGFANWTAVKERYASMTYQDKFCELYELTH